MLQSPPVQRARSIFTFLAIISFAIAVLYPLAYEFLNGMHFYAVHWDARGNHFGFHRPDPYSHDFRWGGPDYGPIRIIPVPPPWFMLLFVPAPMLWAWWHRQGNRQASRRWRTFAGACVLLPVYCVSWVAYLKDQGDLVVQTVAISAVLLAIYGLLYALARVIPAYVPRAEGRLQLGLCPRCGYDIHVTPNRCPECGTTIHRRPTAVSPTDQTANEALQALTTSPPNSADQTQESST